MAVNIYDDHGIRFEYPMGWDLDQDEEGSRVAVTLQSAAGPAFVMVTLDQDRPAPAEMVDEALAAMREEYPGLDATPSMDTISGQPAVGQDVEFFSLDMVNACMIRSVRTAKRSILIFGQWSEPEGDDPELAFDDVLRSLEETDA